MRLGPLTYALPLLQAIPFASAISQMLSPAQPGSENGDADRTMLLEAAASEGLDFRFLLKTSMDRAACAYRLLWGPCPSADEWRRIAQEVDQARQMYRARGWLDHPERYHLTPPALGEPEVVASRSRRTPFSHVTFESEYEPQAGEPGRERWLGYRANRTAHAWVLRHEGAPRPWMMCIHGYGMGYPFVDFEGFPLRKLHERLGFNVIFPVLPLHGPRRVGRISGDRFLDGDPLDTIHAEAQAVWDLRRMLAWMRAQQATAIGVYGLSLGGYNAALLASLDADLSCVIAGIPAVDFVRLGRLHSRRGTLDCAVRSGVSWDYVSDVLRVVSPLALRPRIPSNRLFIFAGSGDLVVPPEQALALWNHWGKPRLDWYRGGHFSFRWEPVVRRVIAEAIAKTMPCEALTAAAQAA